jgi:hypothetical protein
MSKIPVSLKILVDELEAAPLEAQVYLNMVTGEIITLSMDAVDINADSTREGGFAGNHWQRGQLSESQRVLGSKDFVLLPDPSEIDEHHMKKRYCLSIDDYFVRAKILKSIRKKRASRRFELTLEQFGLVNDWLAFRTQEYKAIAAGWLEQHGIPYIDDLV